MTPTGLRELRCPHCRRVLCRADWPAGTRTELRCRDCKTVSIITIATAAGPARLIEHVRIVAGGIARRA